MNEGAPWAGPRPPAWRWLWAAAAIARDPIDRGLLGEYTALLRRAGSPAAEGMFPWVAEHLATGCDVCLTDMQELLRLLEEDEEV
jgi:hypothetical protein